MAVPTKTLRQNSLLTVWPPDCFMDTLSRRSGSLSPTLLLAGIAVFLLFVFWESVTSMVSLWRFSSHQHGPLVFTISAYLIWRMLPQLAGTRLHGEPWGVVAVAILVSIWTVSRLAGIQVTEHASVLALMPATVFAVSGRELSNKLLFSLMFLLVALPVGDSLVTYLMKITAEVSAALLTLSGIPFLRDGQYMSLPGGSFVIAEVCSGIRYLMSGIIVAFLFSYLTFNSYVKRISFVFLTAVILMLANGLRAYLVMVIASATEMRYLGGADHVYFGWALFGVVIMSIMWVGARYADEPEGEGPVGTRGKSIGDNLAGFLLIVVLGLAMLAATLNPLQSEAISTGKLLFGLAVLAVAVILAGRQRKAVSDGCREGREPIANRDWRSIGIIAIVVVLLVIGPQSVAVLQQSATPFAAVPNIDELSSCDSPKSWSNSWFPRMLDADIEVSATLSCVGGQVSIYVAGYASAVQGRELISSSNHLTPNTWRRYSEVSSYQISAGLDGSLRVKELVVDAPGYRGLVWIWYEIDAHRATRGFAVKALQVWALLRGRPAGGHVVLLTTPIATNELAARQRLEAVSVGLIGVDLLVTSGDQT